MNQETSSLQIFFFKHHHKSPVSIYIYIYIRIIQILEKFIRNSIETSGISTTSFELKSIEIMKTWFKLRTTLVYTSPRGENSKVVESWRVKVAKRGSTRSERKFFFYGAGGGEGGERQVQSPSPADIISVNVARVYPHTYLTNSPLSRAGLQRLDRRRLDRVTWRSNLCRME